MNKIAVFNQKGGVGKTSIVVNLSATINKNLGKKILVIDCDAQANASGYFLAFDEREHLTLIDAIEGKCEINDCIYPATINKGHNGKVTLADADIDVLPIDERLDSATIDDITILKRFILNLEDKYDYCFFDCSPQKTTGVLLALCATDYVLVPMDVGDLDSVNGWNMVTNLINEIKESRVNETIRVLGVITNFFNRSRAVHKYMLNNFNETFSETIFRSSLRDSADIEQAKMFRQPICYYKPSCPIARDYDSLAIEVNERIESMNRKVGV